MTEKQKGYLKLLIHKILDTDIPLKEEDSILVFGNIEQLEVKIAKSILPQVEPFEIAYGASYNFVFPFTAKYSSAHQYPSGTSILKSLKVKRFLSEHILDFNKQKIEFPGYHPCTLNDEIHNDDYEQYLFEIEDEESNSIERAQIIDETQKVLKQNVFNNQIWYLTLHAWEPAKEQEITIFNRNKDLNYTHLYGDEEYKTIYGNKENGLYTKSDGNVLLFAVGLTKDKRTLTGYVSFQTCHNLCD